MRKLFVPLLLLGVASIANADSPPAGLPDTVVMVIPGSGQLSGTRTLTWQSSVNGTTPGYYFGPNDGTAQDGDPNAAFLSIQDYTWPGYGSASASDYFVVYGFDGTADGGDGADFSGSSFVRYNNGFSLGTVTVLNDTTNAPDTTYGGSFVATASVPESGVLAGVAPLIALLLRPSRKSASL